jgi:hypothetical protein
MLFSAIDHWKSAVYVLAILVDINDMTGGNILDTNIILNSEKRAAFRLETYCTLG